MPIQRKTMLAALPEPEEINVHEIAGKISGGETDMIVVLGPTASGKTRYAVHLAEKLDREEGLLSEIISADSRQIYRGMDIGTGKDLCEYGDIPYHLIDIADAGTQYNVYEFKRDFEAAWEDIRSRGRVPILCGGTGLYINSVTAGYDFKESQPLSRLRENKAPHNPYIIGTLVSREVRNARIDARLDARLKEGMVEEIKGLLDGGIPAEKLISYGLEYRYVTLYVLGELGFDEMREKLATAIHQFAKRQMTWFRGMERSGAVIHWTEV